jgi:hypothetical protein
MLHWLLFFCRGWTEAYGLVDQSLNEEYQIWTIILLDVLLDGQLNRSSFMLLRFKEKGCQLCLVDLWGKVFFRVDWEWNFRGREVFLKVVLLECIQCSIYLHFFGMIENRVKLLVLDTSVWQLLRWVLHLFRVHRWLGCVLVRSHRFWGGNLSWWVCC